MLFDVRSQFDVMVVGLFFSVRSLLFLRIKPLPLSSPPPDTLGAHDLDSQPSAHRYLRRRPAGGAAGDGENRQCSLSTLRGPAPVLGTSPAWALSPPF